MNKKVFLTLIIVILCLTFTQKTKAEEQGNYFIQTSVHTIHYSNKDYQNNHQKLLGLEYHYPSGLLYGLSYFKNTYDQSTRYFYFGKYYELYKFDSFSLTSKLTFGVVDGYDNNSEEYNTWMHDMETFPGIVAGIGIKKDFLRIDIIPFADAGIIILSGIEF